MLDIRSYGVLLSYMWYTKRLIFCPCSCFGLSGMLIFSDPPSSPRWLDISSNIGFLPDARLPAGLPAEPLPTSKNFFVTMDISSVVIVN
jgi:hypothetical protein